MQENVLTEMLAMAYGPARGGLPPLDGGHTPPPQATPPAGRMTPELAAELAALRRSRRELAAGVPVPASEVTEEMARMVY